MKMNRIQAEEDVEVAERHAEKHSGRHRLSWAHYLWKHSSSGDWMDPSHHHWSSRSCWSGFHLKSLNKIVIQINSNEILLLNFSTELLISWCLVLVNWRWNGFQLMDRRLSSIPSTISTVLESPLACTTLIKASGTSSLFIRIIHYINQLNCAGILLIPRWSMPFSVDILCTWVLRIPFSRNTMEDLRTFSRKFTKSNRFFFFFF